MIDSADPSAVKLARAVIDKRLSSGWGRKNVKRDWQDNRNNKKLVDTATNSLVGIESHCYNGNHHVEQEVCELHKRIEAVSSSLSSVQDVSIDNDKQACWNLVMEQIIAYPMEVMELDRRGRTCLSAACAKTNPPPPLSVITKLVELCKFGTESSRDKNGKTALHIAIQSHASYEIIVELCSAALAPRKKYNKTLVSTPDHRGNLPLHNACALANLHQQYKLLCLLVDAAPQTAGIANHKGETPLHVAVANGAPIPIIELLVNACPSAVSKADCGQSPLVTAICNGADSKILQILLNIDPTLTKKRDDRGRYPLRVALEKRCTDKVSIRLLCTCPEAVLQKTRFGTNAIIFSMDQSKANPDIVRCLLQTVDPGSFPSIRDVAVADENDACVLSNPLYTAYGRFVQAGRVVETLQRRRKDTRAARNEMSQWWEIVVMTLDWYQQEQSSVSRLQLALITNAPMVVISELIDAESVAQKDSDGRYPLHLACMIQVHDDDGSFSSKQKQYNRKEEILNLLLNVDSSQALCKDKSGRYPLNLLTETGASVSPSIVRRMITANPEAVGEIDPLHRLFPYMVLASNSTNVKDSSGAISSIYELVRAKPDLLKESFAVNNSTLNNANK